jgi:hypothetical protein
MLLSDGDTFAFQAANLACVGRGCRRGACSARSWSAVCVRVRALASTRPCILYSESCLAPATRQGLRPFAFDKACEHMHARLVHRVLPCDSPSSPQPMRHASLNTHEPTSNPCTSTSARARGSSRPHQSVGLKRRAPLAAVRARARRSCAPIQIAGTPDGAGRRACVGGGQP